MSYPTIFTEQTQWIVDNRAALNIVFVVHVGDIVEDDLYYWENADASMSLLDGIVPYLVVPGNNDGPYSYVNYNTYFPYTRFESSGYYGGHYPTSGNQNNYGFFSAEGYEFLVLGLEYCASGDPITWAESVLDSNQGKNVIIFTHDYLSSSGSRSSCGNTIWNNLIQYHNNIVLVLSGHISVARRTDYVNGRPIHQVMQDYQGLANGGNGWLRYYNFVPADSIIHVKTYSPHLLAYDTSSGNNFNLALPAAVSTSTPPPTPTVSPTPTITLTPTITPTPTPWDFPRRVNFQPAGSTPYPGYAVSDDSGYGPHGNCEYGWRM
jgi:3',5'-cyclic AMP phosphodiesterase CpdA